MTNEIYVIEWLHPDGTWHIDNDFVAPAYFTYQEAERALELRQLGIVQPSLQRRIVLYTPAPG
jgi:hypothetical protein